VLIFRDGNFKLMFYTRCLLSVCFYVHFISNHTDISLALRVHILITFSVCLNLGYLNILCLPLLFFFSYILFIFSLPPSTSSHTHVSYENVWKTYLQNGWVKCEKKLCIKGVMLMLMVNMMQKWNITWQAFASYYYCYNCYNCCCVQWIESVYCEKWWKQEWKECRKCVKWIFLAYSLFPAHSFAVCTHLEFFPYRFFILWMIWILHLHEKSQFIIIMGKKI
jgi:hypothetical protein